MHRPSWPSLWGLFGVLALCFEAVVRLFPPAIKPLVEGTLTLPQGLVYLATVVFFGFTEGYRGFQKSFSPRAAARALWLDRPEAPTWLKVLAPLFCMALLHATKRRLIANWILVTGIVTLIVLVRMLPHPWRAIVDGGVVVGLSWGSVSLLVCYVQQLRGTAGDVPLALPGEESRRA
jgi:hypothetical protein